MNKPKQKAKLSLVSSQKKISGSKIEHLKANTAMSPDQAALEQLASEEFWKNEIDSLKSEKFNSMQEAVDKLINQVLKRMQTEGSNSEDLRDSEDLREFLRLVFESSEYLSSTLQKTLKISL